MNFRSWIILRKAFFIRFVMIGLLLVVLALISVKIIHSNVLGWLSMISIASLLTVGSYLFKKYFYKPSYFHISDSALIISSESNPELNKTISFDQISSYSVEIISPKFYSIIFYLLSGSKIEYSLPQNKITDNDNNTLLLIEVINNKIAEYNRKVNKDSKGIVLRPSFFGTSIGLFLIICISAISVIVFCFSIYYIPKFSMFGLFAFSFSIIQMIAKSDCIDPVNPIWGYPCYPI